MAYPQTFLNKTIRRAFMLFLIAIFFVCAPIIIAYTSGYRYDIATKEIQQTGVISIDVEPEDVIVELNGIFIEKKMPLRLSNRAPGTYHLRITKDGYQPWEKDITVTSKQTTYIRGVTLFRTATPASLTDSSTQNISEVSVSETGAYILTRQIKNNTAYEVTLIDTQTKIVSVIKRGDAAMAPAISWSPRHEIALFVTNNGEAVNVELFDPAQLQIVFTQNITPASRTNLFQWNADNRSPSVWIRDHDEVFLASENGRSASMALPPQTEVWFVDNNNTVWSYNTTQRLIITSDNRNAQYSTDEQINDIIDINDDRIIAKSGNHYVVLSRHDQGVQSLQANHHRLNPFTGEWNIWSDSELWTIYPDGHVTLLNRTGEQINDVYPLDPFGVLLLSTGKGMIGFNPGYYVIHDLLLKNTALPIGVNQDTRMIYFIDTSETSRSVYELPY